MTWPSRWRPGRCSAAGACGATGRALLDSVRSGSSAARSRGGNDDFAHLDADPPAADLFHRAMTNLTQAVAAAFAASIDIGGDLRVVDVGGGYGQLITTLLLAHPRLHGVLFDLPHAIEPRHRPARAHGLSSRCELVSGSFFDALPSGRGRLPAQERVARLGRCTLRDGSCGAATRRWRSGWVRGCS